MTLSVKDRDLMEHATGWRSREPLYRNYYAANDGGPSYLAWCSLVERGLAGRFTPANVTPGLEFGLIYFGVTEVGIQELKRADAKDSKKQRRKRAKK